MVSFLHPDYSISPEQDRGREDSTIVTFATEEIAFAIAAERSGVGAVSALTWDAKSAIAAC
jgi:hypothetical protein